VRPPPANEQGARDLDMPAFFVHGVPDTYRLWDGVRRHLRRTDVIACSLPGFGTPLPDGFAATKESYVDWIVDEIERVAESVDLVGHDWGANLVQRVVSLRPDLVRTWACGSGVIDVEYAWHPLAQQWQTPGVGEQLMQLTTAEALAEGLAQAGMPPPVAVEAAARVDDVMKASILSLYRSALDLAREWQAGIERVARPALVLWGARDPYAEVRFAERLAARVRGGLCVLDAGHWWPAERPVEAAAALERFWAAGRG
jgi:pimeloyl-ACP methyl ester carboxylesterase